MNTENGCWVVLDARGNLIAEAESHHEAVEWCRQQGLVPVADEIEDLEEFEDQALPMAANPATGGGSKKRKSDVPLAMRESGIKPIEPQTFMSPKTTREAWEVMRGYFPVERSAGASPVKYLRSPGEFWDAWLGGNDKLDKTASGGPAYITGLSILPYTRWMSTMWDLHEGDGKLHYANEAYTPFDRDWQRRFVRMTEGDYREMRGDGSKAPKRQYNVCARSTPACREGCLAETGRNVGVHAFVKKFVLTTMLHLHPEEFAVMLARKVMGFAEHSWGPSGNFGPGEPMVRLNCYSDLPWERIVPWLFEEFSPRSKYPVTFYDYTKLLGRAPKAAENYDLTFSFALSNLMDCWSEVQEGARVAVIFAQNNLPPVGSRFLWPNPETMIDKHGILLPVVSGTDDDARSRDPKQSLIALKWKPPRRYRGDASAFVVRAKKMGRYYAMDAHMPRRTHVEEREED